MFEEGDRIAVIVASVGGRNRKPRSPADKQSQPGGCAEKQIDVAGGQSNVVKTLAQWQWELGRDRG